MTDETAEVAASEEKPAESSTAAPDAGRPNPHAGFQRRIDQLTREKHELRRQLESLKAPKEELKQAAAAEDKTLADFDFDEVAYRKHIREISAEEARKAARGVLDETKRNEQQQSRAKTWKERSAAFAAEHTDFTEKVYADDVQISESMFEAITESEHGPAIAYYLADNPEEAERIANMSAAAAGRAIGRIEAKLESQSAGRKDQSSETSEENAEEGRQDNKRVTKAPPPPPKIEGSADVVAKDPDKMTTDEWLRWRNKQLSKKK